MRRFFIFYYILFEVLKLVFTVSLPKFLNIVKLKLVHNHAPCWQITLAYVMYIEEFLNDLIPCLQNEHFYIGSKAQVNTHLLLFFGTEKQAYQLYCTCTRQKRICFLLDSAKSKKMDHFFCRKKTTIKSFEKKTKRWSSFLRFVVINKKI